MARRENLNHEPYAGYIAPSQIPQINPINTFYSREAECARYFCAVCGVCHPVSTHQTQRTMEWLTGTTLPDAMYRSTEANIIDNMTQLRFKQARQTNAQPCQKLDEEIDMEKKLRRALNPCDHGQK